MDFVVVFLFVVNVLYGGLMFFMIHAHRRERLHYLDFIDRLQNKLMARDLSEYTAQFRSPSSLKVHNPILENIRRNQKERMANYENDASNAD